MTIDKAQLAAVRGGYDSTMVNIVNDCATKDYWASRFQQSSPRTSPRRAEGVKQAADSCWAQLRWYGSMGLFEK